MLYPLSYERGWIGGRNYSFIAQIEGIVKSWVGNLTVEPHIVKIDSQMVFGLTPAQAGVQFSPFECRE